MSAASKPRVRQTLTPFVGRDEEIALLLDLWRRAAAGEGQVAMLSGEAGIGKSRILAALARAPRRASRTSSSAINARRIMSTTPSIP